jgi:hypothetical protein
MIIDPTEESTTLDFSKTKNGTFSVLQLLMRRVRQTSLLKSAFNITKMRQIIQLIFELRRNTVNQTNQEAAVLTDDLVLTIERANA